MHPDFFFFKKNAWWFEFILLRFDLSMKLDTSNKPNFGDKGGGQARMNKGVWHVYSRYKNV